MRFDAIDWAAALSAATRDADAGGLSRRSLADLTSLSALFTDSFPTAAARVAAARASDPFNPAHSARFALLLMRFGDWESAARLAESIAATAPDLALPRHLWALAALRQEEPRRAANLAQDVLTAHPKFAPAAFLRAEAQAKTQLKGVRKHLTDLPRGAAHAPAWADLAIKMLLSGSEDVAKLVPPLLKDARIFPPGSRSAQLVALVVEMTEETVEQIEQRLEKIPAGSRAEEVVLLVLHDCLQKGNLQEGAERLRALHDRLADRSAVRRLYVSLLTRLAVAEATADHHADALRLVEACLRLEPHETAHYQNRATLFSLMREVEPYNGSWFELNRHQYRLALLGKLSTSDAARLAKPHRLFAQQARMSPQGAGGIRSDAGILAEKIVQRDVGNAKVLTINQAKLDDDPELIRQWIHHLRAELVFAHLTLGPDPRRFLLHPDNRRMARARAESLALFATSLGVLVPDEGRMLADRIVHGWAGAADRVVSTYGAAPDDADVKVVQSRYLEAFADLVTVCCEWRPDGRNEELTNEVIAFINGLAPFFDERALAIAVKDCGGSLTLSLSDLTSYVDALLGLDPTRERRLTDHERLRVGKDLVVKLLIRQAFSTYNLFRDKGSGADKAIVLLDRARELDPDNPRVLVTAADFYSIGGYYSEAESLVARVQQSPQAKTFAEQVDEVKRLLDDRRKVKDKGRQREDSPATAYHDVASSDLAAALEQEIERFPSSVQSYEELAELHAAAGRFSEALEWSTLAMDRCSSRDAQIRARSLNLEILGLEALAKRDQNAVRLYLAGVHRPALDIINGETGQRPYPLSYLLGCCLLAVNQPETAREAFEAALAGCERSSHRVILRRLAADVDQAYLSIARQSIQDKLAANAFEEALHEVGGMMARLRKPQAGFIDLARVHTAAATARLGSEVAPMPRPAGAEAEAEAEAWEGPLAAAYAEANDRGRARRLAELALQADPESAPRANPLLQRLDLLDAQAAIANALGQSGALLREGKTEAALAALDAGDGADPRIVRQRALILLKLERFDAAEAAVAAIHGSTASVAREFLSAYPGLAFRQRIAVACRMIRAGIDVEALAVLAAATPQSEEDRVEYGYCRGFCRAMAGFRLRRQGKKADARRALSDALREIEPHVTAARRLRHTRLLELYDQLDKDPDLATMGENA